MRVRKCSRAATKLPRVKSLWARSKALSAAASSREGWRGGAGACLGAGLVVAAAGLEDLAGEPLAGWALAAAFFAGADFGGAVCAFVPALADLAAGFFE